MEKTPTRTEDGLEAPPANGNTPASFAATPRTASSTPTGAPPAAGGLGESESAAPKQIIGRFLSDGPNGLPGESAGAGPAASLAPSSPPVGRASPGPRIPVVLFCHESPESYIGGHAQQMARTLARRGNTVHLFSRDPFPELGTEVEVHAVGSVDEGDVVAQAEEYSRRASNAYLQQFSAAGPVAVVGYEWTSIPALTLLQGVRNIRPVLSLHSLERQRSDASSDIARKISAVELTGLQQARTLLMHDPATAEVARLWLPECVDRIQHARQLFPAQNFDLDLDPGSVKARYQVGPLDPLLLYVGDLSEPYGPDFLVKAMPALLRHHKQARLVVVGDGSLFWPLKVYSRYLLLEHAVRLPGHVQDQPLCELIRASDLVLVPSRQATPWWPILAAWAAGRPLVATHNAAPGLLEHESDAVLIYPSENSVVWGVERLLYDESLRQKLAVNGKKKLEERFGWTALAAQLEEVAGIVPAAAPAGSQGVALG